MLRAGCVVFDVIYVYISIDASEFQIVFGADLRSIPDKAKVYFFQ